MKKATGVLLTVFLLMSLCGSAFAQETESGGMMYGTAETESEQSQTEGDQECEWNVLIYLCGTDLESQSGAATKNLLDIVATVPDDSVNLIVETGGAAQWDPAQKLGFDIANDRLQRWYYGKDGFTLVDEAEDASMSDERTLSDFIQWSGENYSAKKNMLVLWDHGGGSNSGLLVDENYDSSIMPVYALEKALCDGGTHFDLVLSDTCLMASLEMCQALAPYADYLAASEEVMAGDGTDYERWVQYVYDRPECSAVQLGKRICDYTQQYYTEANDSDTVGFFTMSLIDLSKTDAVAQTFNTFMREVADLVQDPDAFYSYARATWYSENYYLNTMYDLFDLSRRAESGGVSKNVTHALQDAVEDAVLYNLRSKNHMYSHGLSVFYSLNEDSNKLDHFARTSKNAEHLAFLDCISMKWNAPEWVYQQTERHPELNRSNYSVDIDAECPEDGSGAFLTFESGFESSVFLSYELNYKDQNTGVMYTLGESGNLIPQIDEDEGNLRYALGFDGTWPSLDGKPLCMSIVDDTESYVLYNVPIGVYGQQMQLRVMVNYEESDQNEDPDAQEDTENMEEDPDAQDDPADTEETEQPSVHDDTDGNPYVLLGVWDGFDAHTGLPGRNNLPISSIAGTTVDLYDVVYSGMLDRIADYVPCAEVQITENTDINREPLPEGEYMIRFVVRDVFNNAHYSDYVTLNWNGEAVEEYYLEDNAG